jgi:hypothetical protein
MMPKSVTFYSEGVKLAGDLFLPADIKRGERRAGIVLCHGYTGVRNQRKCPRCRPLELGLRHYKKSVDPTVAIHCKLTTRCQCASLVAPAST